MNVWKTRLSALLLCQLVAAVALWGVSLRGEAARARASRLTNFQTERVNKVELSKGEDSLMLIKADGQWKLPDYHELPADEQKVTNLLKELSNLSSSGPETTTDSSHERFKVAKESPEAHLKLYAGEEVVSDLLMGKSPTFGKRYVRLEGESEVYRTDWDGFNVTARGRDWLDSDLLAATGLGKVTFPEFELVHQNGRWTLDGEELDQEKVTTLLNNLTKLRVLEVAELEPQSGFEVKVENKDETLTYTFFENDGKHYLWRSDQSLVFQVPENTAETLREAAPGGLRMEKNDEEAEGS